MLRAYCIRRAGDPPPPPGLRGVAGEPVELLEDAGLGLWLSRGPQLPPTLERIREHDRVVRAALGTATPLPVRFGAHFADPDRAGEALRQRPAELLAALERVAQRVEMGIRVRSRAPVATGEGPETEPAIHTGRQYLELRRRRLQREAELRERADALLDRVVACFAELDVLEVRQRGSDPHVAGAVAHLVHRSNIDQYRECAESARRCVPEVELIFSGPWAPYSFVGGT